MTAISDSLSLSHALGLLENFQTISNSFLLSPLQTSEHIKKPTLYQLCPGWMSFFLLTWAGGGGGVGSEEERISLSAGSWSEEVPVPPPELLSFTEWKLTLHRAQLEMTLSILYWDGGSVLTNIVLHTFILKINLANKISFKTESKQNLFFL